MSFDLSQTLQVLEIIEREQRRIGQDLHDSLGQILTGIEFISKILEQKLSSKFNLSLPSVLLYSIKPGSGFIEYPLQPVF